jgi:hypoxanthine phosphoribosyltransferase
MVDANTIIDYSYIDFCSGIDHIARSIKSSGWSPDYIVGIVRGGSVPAVYLSHKLKVPVVMVSWSTRDTTIFGKESNCWIPEDIHKGKKVLVVDDIVDGGDTIRELLDDWNKSTAGLGDLPVDNLRVAAMYYNTAQDVNVDFYHREIDRNEDERWVIFPWEA